MSQNNVGIYASQISGHLWAPAGAYDALATVTVPSGGAASIEFVGIPAGYKHLQIRANCKVNGTAGDFPDFMIRFNSDSTYTNYFSHQIGGDGSSAYANTSNSSPTATGGLAGDINGSRFTGKVIDVLDYANTNKNKTTRTLSGWDSNGSGQIRFASNLWINTSAITSITLLVRSSPTTISEYSSFALYGVK